MKEYTINIDKRPVLVDRIQVNVTPSRNYIYEFEIEVNSYHILKKWTLKHEFSEYKDLIIKNRKLKKLDYKTFRKDKRFHYLINIPCDIPYVSDVKVSAFEPFSVSFKINFIRLLREKIKEKWELNSCYDKQIMLDADNYVCPKIWPEWNYNLISDVLNELEDICIKIADSSLYYIIPFHNVKYEKVTVKQIETNIDYNVGFNNSLFAINTLLKIFTTKQGKEFREKVGSVAIKNRIPFEETSKDPTMINKNESVSIQFQICKGLFFKIYRKTRDHIRAELLFEKSYLQNKFKKYESELFGKQSISTDIKRIVKPVLEFSKGFYKNLDFENYIKNELLNPNELFVMDYINPVYNVLMNYSPPLFDLICCIKNNHPVTDMKTKKFIQKNRKIARFFYRSYMGDLGYVYIFKNEKNNMVKPEKKLSKDDILIGDRRRLFPWEQVKYKKTPVDVWKRPVPYDKNDFPTFSDIK
jgi:hypothetical protein